ncbi:hypothetical protein CW751_06175 [Brumimicrobium salinarum]|uniref:Lipoprotein n=1 Tax=Brumimicrobium salinarum TaxID=2058658 RepID=A0A2I0R3L3_9FLAO|nr:hypothetical protein [Brumimicrobium salinarum]PKR81168.1 hypothetical protein CW751_06175 [Brumimicrobium salinarum]
MKKVFLGALVLGGLALTSCKKDYKCTYTGPNDTKIVDEYKDLTKSEAEDKEADCEGGVIEGTWSTD